MEFPNLRFRQDLEQAGRRLLSNRESPKPLGNFPIGLRHLSGNRVEEVQSVSRPDDSRALSTGAEARSFHGIKLLSKRAALDAPGERPSLCEPFTSHRHLTPRVEDVIPVTGASCAGGSTLLALRNLPRATDINWPHMAEATSDGHLEGHTGDN